LLGLHTELVRPKITLTVTKEAPNAHPTLPPPFWQASALGCRQIIFAFQNHLDIEFWVFACEPTGWTLDIVSGFLARARILANARPLIRQVNAP